ncbi:MAG: zinc-dependent metalloprotease [Fimbriimonas sp.]
MHNTLGDAHAKMTKSLSLAALAVVFGVCLPASGLAQSTGDQKAEVKKEEKDPKVTAYETAIKDLKRIDGAFPMYQRKKEILLELPEDKLGKIFLLQATLATGLDSALLHAGMPIGNNAVDAFRFDRNEEQVWLVRPTIANRWQKGDDFALGAERQFQEAILGSFKIEQQNPEKKLLLVNVTQLFYGDVIRLSEMVSQGLGGQYMLDREKSSVESVKGFPENSTVQMKLHYMSPRGGGGGGMMALLGLSAPISLEDDRSAPLKVTYSVWFRKEDGYTPRNADPRIGYFTESFFSIDKYLNTDRTERYINRFHLVKKDPTAKVSEAVKPIVFTLDNSIPADYREAVKSGVLRWNKAFDALGFKNAVQVQEQPKENYDHADGRYNVIRMMVSPSSPFGAISLFRTDPFTGEILNVGITLDGNIIRDLQQEHLRNVSSHVGAGKRALEVMTRDPQRTTTDDEFLFATPAEMARKEAFAKMSRFGLAGELCTNAAEQASAGVLSWIAVQAAPVKADKEEYVKKFLADCVSHEVGHALGLRHNFAGSTNLSTNELADDKLTSEQGTSASVMDYTPANVQAVLKGSGNFYAPVIGPYDVWAIKYGYSDFGKTTTGEKFQLAQIASASGERGHAFMTDEDADSWNPYAVRFDGGSDPLVFSSKMIVAMKRARDYAILNLPRKGESYSKRTNVVLSSIMRSFREGRTAARFVGGIAASRNFKGDSGEKPTMAPVNPALQRQAAKMIAANFLAPGAFKMPESVLTSLSTDENEGSWTAPVRDFIGFNQQNLVALMLSASASDRIAENSYKVKGAYGLDEHYQIVTGAVFAEVGTNQSIDPLRRDLQRFLVNGLTTIAGAPNGAVNEDSRMLASQSLSSLRNKMLAQLKHSDKLDNMTRLHLKDSSESIGRFLNRTNVVAR